MSAARMLAEARKDLGMKGRPNPITRAYAKRHGEVFLEAPWCQMSITDWARASGNAAAVLPEGDRAYTVWHAQDGQRLGRWHAGTVANLKKYARPGAVVFFDWGGTDSIARIDHVGLIERVLPDGRVVCIEGNTGDACKRRVRSASVIAGFWNPAYEEEGDMPTAKEIADAVFERFTHEVSAEHWAAREGILVAGQRIDPRGALRQIWAYAKDGYHRDREILARLEAQDATIKAMAEALATRDSEIDVEALMARIRAAIEGTTVRLDVPDDLA